LWRRTSAQFFLRQWGSAGRVAAPADRADAYRRAWKREVVGGEDEASLPAWRWRAGITAGELEEEIAVRATAAWILEQGPEVFGVSFAAHRRAVGALAPEGPGAAAILEQAAQGTCVAAWASSAGIVCPPPVAEAFVAAWERDHSRAEFLGRSGLSEGEYLDLWAERALYHWLLDQGPTFFGFVTWSFPQAALRELQMTGEVLALVEATAERTG